MALWQYNTSSPFDEFDRFFDDAFGSGWAVIPTRSQSGQRSQQTQRFFRPKLDLRENPDNTLTAILEVPGLKREDVNIELHGDRLTISGERKHEKETRPAEEGETGERRGHSWVLRERYYGKFSRDIGVPEGTTPEDIKASVQDGILTVSFPKQKPQAEPKKITIS
ncbi:HSP20-like chaperone [Cantharellus anzutake]|uniref:HSP20-like chaperone n=1 Tax=Cantharellus anzutake TaxID=1750568 RepID=UPI0019030A07|nr:HSP20-like chaperone [Cantharellus anzutake]KAF8334090.1 HSP20-like chaperone [Cantharellus anzutake]